MQLSGFSHPGRWLVLPATAVVLPWVSRELMSLGLVALAGLFLVGYVEQGVRLGRLPARARAFEIVVGLPLALAATYLKSAWPWAEADLTALVVVSLSGGSGFLTGVLAAGLPSRSAETGRSWLDRVARADELAVFAPASLEQEPPVETIDPQQVEVYVDGHWHPGTLDAWRTEDLGLFGRVRFGGATEPAWKHADLLRRADQA